MKQSTSQKLGERTIDLFELRNVPVYEKKAPTLIQPPYVVRQAPYTTCYKVDGAIDAKLYITRNRIVNIECKSQYGSGTTDEKFPYVFRCFEYARDCTEFILLYDGEHWTHSAKGRAAIQWAKEEAIAFEHRFRKPVNVLDWKGFQNWLIKEFSI